MFCLDVIPNLCDAIPLTNAIRLPLQRYFPALTKILPLQCKTKTSIDMGKKLKTIIAAAALIFSANTVSSQNQEAVAVSDTAKKEHKSP